MNEKIIKKLAEELRETPVNSTYHERAVREVPWNCGAFLVGGLREEDGVYGGKQRTLYVVKQMLRGNKETAITSIYTHDNPSIPEGQDPNWMKAMGWKKMAKTRSIYGDGNISWYILHLTAKDKQKITKLLTKDK